MSEVLSIIKDTLTSFRIDSEPPHTNHMYLKQAEDFVRGMRELTRIVYPTYKPVIESVLDEKYQSLDAEVLDKLLASYGSDKPNFHHGYHFVYSTLIKPKVPITLLEIGLGTNNIDIPSNMGRHGRPGASLRAFRDYIDVAESKLYGADIDDRILFQEDNIKTASVDQLNLDTLRSLPYRLGETQSSGFDIIIDDGLHAMGPNINVITTLLPFVKVGGHLIVEDIVGGPSKYGWLAIDAVLAASDKYDTRFVRAKSGSYMYLIRVVAR